MKAKDIVVVGGGITGLVAAHRLRQALASRALDGASPQLTLIESDKRLGGKVITERADGFVIEGGPDNFVSFKPRGLGLCYELGLRNRLRGAAPAAQRMFVARRGKLYALPDDLAGFLPSRTSSLLWTGLLSPLGVVRMGLEWFIPPLALPRDESLAAFVERRLGREAYERLVEPLVGGIYAGDGAQLSVAATFPQWRQLEATYGGLIRGVFALQRKSVIGSHGAPASSPGKKPPMYLSLATGLAELVQALAERLDGVDISLGARVSRVDADASGGGFTLTLDGPAQRHADAVVLTTPAYVTARMVAGLDHALAELLYGIPYVSAAVVSVAYPLADGARPLEGYGYVVPRSEGRAVRSCMWSSSKFPQHARKGWGLLRALLSDAGQPDLLDRTDDDLVRMVCDDLSAVLGTAPRPALQRVFRWAKAMPNYAPGHLERLARIGQCLTRHPGLYVAGSAYHGIGIPDCIASGEAVAAQVIALVGA